MNMLIDLRWSYVSTLNEEELSDSGYNSIVEHFPFQKGFMFAFKFDNLMFDETYGFFKYSYIYRDGEVLNSIELGKPICSDLD